VLQRLVVPLLAVAIGLVLAVPALAQPAEPLVKVATDPTLGRILVDSEGMTLYLYSRDEKGVSNCYDMCEQRWPILRPPAGGAPTGAPDINGTLGTIQRRDGTMQVTYNDIPLYYWFQDEKAGDTRGQAVGGVWWILPPGISQITPAVAQPSPPAAPAPPPAAKPAAPAPAAKPAAPAQAPAPAAKPAAQPSPAAKPAAKPAAPVQAPAAKPAAKPAAMPSPSALPRTGGLPFDPTPLTVGLGVAGTALTVVGASLLRRRNARRRD
jgi:predicted lipoprotein with Yx(FWY)xxD motif